MAPSLSRFPAPARPGSPNRPSLHDGEKFNAVTHLVGAALALAGAVVLVVVAAADGDPWKVVGVSVYGVTLVSLYSVSVLYHSSRGRSKEVLRELDHQGIYLLIAGSYTPFCLVSLRGAWGWSLLGIVWGLAVLGGVQEFRTRSGPRILSVLIYILMGWVAIAAWIPLVEVLSPPGFAWLAVGGLFYTLGIVFYAIDTRVAHAHGVWHLFVLAGSACHYFAILLYVL